MHQLFFRLVEEIEFSGSVRQDVAVFLTHHECLKTVAHSIQVGEQATLLAQRFGASPRKAALAGWLHDISAVIPNKKRLNAAQELELEILPIEAEVPLLLHQKLSLEIARQIFNIKDEEVLDAIGCHTTLKPNPSQLDCVLFVADKLAWDKKGKPPYFDDLQTGLEYSLEQAAYQYQYYLLHSGKIITPHPWMLASYRQLSEKFG
jgi:predicted HD superfamily hydrolase involved in NAD metabolism